MNIITGKLKLSQILNANQNGVMDIYVGLSLASSNVHYFRFNE